MDIVINFASHGKKEVSGSYVSVDKNAVPEKMLFNVFLCCHRTASATTPAGQPWHVACGVARCL
jgi:hypothetical protein